MSEIWVGENCIHRREPEICPEPQHKKYVLVEEPTLIERIIQFRHQCEQNNNIYAEKAWKLLSEALKELERCKKRQEK